jgi:hypothetical protein
MDSGLGNLVAFREINLTLRQHDYFLRLSTTSLTVNVFPMPGTPDRSNSQR